MFYFKLSVFFSKFNVFRERLFILEAHSSFFRGEGHRNLPPHRRRRFCCCLVSFAVPSPLPWYDTVTPSWQAQANYQTESYVSLPGRDLPVKKLPVQLTCVLTPSGLSSVKATTDGHITDSSGKDIQRGQTLQGHLLSQGAE